MGRFRFKVRTIIGWVVVCGIALAALTDSSDLWNEGIFSFTVLILLLSALEALHTRRAQSVLARFRALRLGVTGALIDRANRVPAGLIARACLSSFQAPPS